MNASTNNNPHADAPAALTISEYIETPNGKALRKLLRSKYIDRKTVKTSEALAFLCVSEIYYCLFEGSINPGDYYLPEGFEDIPPKDVLEGFESWATSDYCSDILALSNEDYRYEEFRAALRFAWETWFDDGKDPYSADEKPRDTATGKTKYTVADIDWDTGDYDSCDPCDPNVPDLPDEILVVADKKPDEDRIGDAISSRTSFCVNGFSVTETPDADEDEFDTVIYL